MFAGEWFFSLVDENVRLELIRVGKVRGAEVAFVGFLSSVDTQMAAKICYLDKLTFAVSAAVPA